MKLIIDRVYFVRVMLHLEGTIHGLEDPQKAHFTFYNKTTGGSLEFDNIRFDGNRFDIRINVMGMQDDMPLQTGKWFLRAEVDGKPYKGFVSDAVYDQIYLALGHGITHDLMVDRGETNYWHGLSRLTEKSWIYYLDVDYTLVRENRRLAKMKRAVKAWITKRKKNMRRRLYHAGFRFFNRVIKKNGKRVLITSNRSAEISGNEKMIYECLKKRGLDKEYDIRLSFKDGGEAYRSMKEKISFTYYLATSDIIIVDDYMKELYENEYDPSVKIVQTWHACGAFKTVGFERIHAKGAPALDTKNHKCYTHVLVSSEHSADHNAEAFAIRRDRFYATGIPRTDVFFDEAYKTQTRERVYAAYPWLKEKKKVILYAPTFRGNGAKSAYFPMQMIHFQKLGDCLHEMDAVMMIKMHPFVRDALEIPEAYSDCFLDVGSYPDINELLLVTDLLITDYSSVIYEAGLLRVPMLFYAFDLENYNGDRGFYEPIEDIVPGKIVSTLQGLLIALREQDYESEKLEPFLKKNFTYIDGHATDRAVDLIFGQK